MGEGWLARLQSCLSKDSTYGKKSTEQVDHRDYDKDQQHREHRQHDEERSEFLDHSSTLFATNVPIREESFELIDRQVFRRIDSWKRVSQR